MFAFSETYMFRNWHDNMYVSKKRNFSFAFKIKKTGWTSKGGGRVRKEKFGKRLKCEPLLEKIPTAAGMELGMLPL